MTITQSYFLNKIAQIENALNKGHLVNTHLRVVKKTWLPVGLAPLYPMPR